MWAHLSIRTKLRHPLGDTTEVVQENINSICCVIVELSFCLPILQQYAMMMMMMIRLSYSMIIVYENYDNELFENDGSMGISLSIIVYSILLLLCQQETETMQKALFTVSTSFLVQSIDIKRFVIMLRIQVNLGILIFKKHPCCC